MPYSTEPSAQRMPQPLAVERSAEPVLKDQDAPSEESPSGGDVSGAALTQNHRVTHLHQATKTKQLTEEYDPKSVAACEAQKRASSFYIDPTGQAMRAERELRTQGDHEQAALLREIACDPVAVWLMGSAETARTKEKIQDVLASTERSSAIAVFVLYNQPLHERAEWESGRTEEAYSAWIRDIADAIGNAEAWVILEPDALALAVQYSETQRDKRISELANAVTILTDHSNARVYIDAGHSHWLSVDEAVELLSAAGAEAAHGFALNVSNYRRTDEAIAYGRAIAQHVGGAHFVIDTSRNGAGPHPEAEWCNAPGRAVGERPTLVPHEPLLDAYLWVKPPGESDGTCNGGPPAGKFWTSYALDLVRNAKAVN